MAVVRFSSDVDRAAGGPRGAMVVDDDLSARVAGWRRQRMSWAAIARNLGRAEPDVRREFGGAS